MPGAVVLLADACAIAAPPDDAYRLGPDSEPHEGVPQGKVIGPTALASNVYPNTTRNYWVYVPASMTRPGRHALMVFFDGHAYVGLKGQLPDPLRVRQPDLPQRDARHDRRLHQPRPQALIRRKHRMPTGAIGPPTAAWNTTHWMTNIPSSSLTSCCRS